MSVNRSRQASPQGSERRNSFLAASTNPGRRDDGTSFRVVPRRHVRAKVHGPGKLSRFVHSCATPTPRGVGKNVRQAGPTMSPRGRTRRRVGSHLKLPGRSAVRSRRILATEVTENTETLWCPLCSVAINGPETGCWPHPQSGRTDERMTFPVGSRGRARVRARESLRVPEFPPIRLLIRDEHSARSQANDQRSIRHPVPGWRTLQDPKVCRSIGHGRKSGDRSTDR